MRPVHAPLFLLRRRRYAKKRIELEWQEGFGGKKSRTVERPSLEATSPRVSFWLPSSGPNLTKAQLITHHLHPPLYFVEVHSLPRQTLPRPHITIHTHIGVTSDGKHPRASFSC